MVNMLVGILFVLVAALFCVAAFFALLGVSQVKMMSPDAIERDGMANGLAGPRWSLIDGRGNLIQSPPTQAMLQLIVFSDHSLKSFPSVIRGLHTISIRDPGQLEVVLLLRRPSELAERIVPLLGLDVPVVTGSPSLYARYNVRVTPFVIIVDSSGLVCASSLVNHDWQLEKLLELARLAISGRPQTGAHHVYGRQSVVRSGHGANL